MNLEFVFPRELALMLNDVTTIFADTELAVSITYRSFTSRTFTPSTGAWTPTYTDTTIGAIRNELSLQEIAASDGLYQMGDLQFIIERATLATPSKEDRIVDGTEVFDLIKWESDPLNALWRIVARKVA